MILSISADTRQLGVSYSFEGVYTPKIRICMFTKNKNVYRYHIFFIHSSFDGLQVVAVSWLLSIVLLCTYKCMYLFGFEFCLDICTRVGFLDYMVILFLCSEELPYCFPYWLCQFTSPPTVQEGSLFPTSSSAYAICRRFKDGHSDQCEVVTHCSFDLHFFND